MNRVTSRWFVGEYAIEAVTDHGFTDDAEVMYRYAINGRTATELYLTLDHALAAAIAAKHTGPRGAGGTGVGTAADWFMRMIGAAEQ